ncbi:hypothetical protein D9M69_638300 [compost metagenome]
MLLLVGPAHELAHPVRQALGRVGEVAEALHHAQVHLVRQVAGDPVEQVVDGVEMVVQGAAGHARFLGQVADVDLVRAFALGQQAQRGLVDPPLGGAQGFHGGLSECMTGEIEHACSIQVKNSRSRSCLIPFKQPLSA